MRRRREDLIPDQGSSLFCEDDECSTSVAPGEETFPDEPLGGLRFARRKSVGHATSPRSLSDCGTRPVKSSSRRPSSDAATVAFGEGLAPISDAPGGAIIGDASVQERSMDASDTASSRALQLATGATGARYACVSISSGRPNAR